MPKFPRVFSRSRTPAPSSGTTDASQDISFSAMSRLQDQMARIVLADPAVETLGSFIGASSGSTTVNNGRMFITLKPRSERPGKVTADQIIARLRKKTSRIPGATLILQASQDIRVGGRSGKGQYVYALQSSSLDDLNRWAPHP